MKKIRTFRKSKTIDKLWNGLALLHDPKELKLFLEDILYPSEISMLGQRLLVATLLRKGTTYDEIVEKTGAGKNMINRVWNTLYGGTGGYELFFSALNQRQVREEHEKREYDKSPLQRYTKRRLSRGK